MESAAENGAQPFETTPRETKPLEFLPTSGNSVVWNHEDGLIAVAASAVVTVFHPSRMDGTVGLAAWKEMVPRLGSPAEEFEDYRARLLRERETRHSTGGEKKKASASKKSEDVNRGGNLGNLTRLLDMTKKMKGSGRGIEASLGACQLFDDAYWNSELPKITSISWSPSMCSDTGRSVLGVIFDDASAMVFAASDGLTPMWIPLINLSPLVDTLSEDSNSFYDSRFTNISWSDAVYDDQTGLCFSIISVASQDGGVHLWRMQHLQTLGIDEDQSITRFEERVSYIGHISIAGERVQEMAWTCVPHEGDRKAELVAVFGCGSGSVAAWRMQSSTLGALDPSSWNEPVDMTDLDDNKPVLILPRDSLIVSSLACCLRYVEQSLQLLICVGKTCGTIHMYASDKISRTQSVEEAMVDGHRIHVPHKMDSHSISGTSFHCQGDIVVATTRLGNMVSFKIPREWKPDISLIPNPVHGFDGPLAYKGYGCFGVAASPGGHFIAVVRQALQPDIEYKKQLQIHQKVTQGFVHIQSLVDPRENLSGIGSALERCIHTWSTQSQTSSDVLWDVERLVELAEHCMDKESLLQMLGDAQEFCSTVSTDGDNGVDSFEQNRRIAAMLRMLMALPLELRTGTEQISNVELLAMKHHIHTNLLEHHSTPEGKLSALLALDFVVTHKNTPCFSDAIVQKAQDMYTMLGEDVVIDDAPKRPLSITLPELTAEIQRGPLNESLNAVVEFKGKESFTVARCPMTLFGLVDGGRWECRSCHRNYSRPPQPRHYYKHWRRVPAPTTCPICAGIVGLTQPEWLFNQ